MRLSLVLALAACRALPGRPPQHATADLAPTTTARSAAADLAFDVPPHDVWAFEVHVSGTVDEACAAVEVSGPRGAVPARVAGGRFEARAPLGEGDNRLVARCTDPDQGGVVAVSAPLVLRVPLADDPVARARVVLADGAVRLDGGGSEPGVTRPAPIVSWSWSERPGNPAPLRTVEGERVRGARGPEVAIGAPTRAGQYTVALTVTDADGRTDQAAAMFEVRHGEPLLVDLERDHPEWVDDAVVYGVVPSFFGPGGRLDDVRERLDEIADLGADTLWLSPIFDCPDDDFGYAVRDPFAVRSELGGEDDLRELVDAAHARGLRVVLDLVPNHTSAEHPYFVAGEPYGDWYERDDEGEVEHYFDWEHLPNLDYDNPEVQAYVLEASVRWVRDFDVDGFRVDVAWGVRERAPEFWDRWRAELKRIEPELLLLAEGTGRDGWWYDHGYDAAYDWTWDLGVWAWRDAFEDPAHTAERLREALTAEGDGYPPDAKVFRFLDNNDTEDRFVTRYGVDVTALAATLLLTIDGLPLVYTGQDVGAALRPYDEGPPVDWSADPHGLRRIYRDRIALRRALPALRSGRTTHFEVHPDVVSYVRHPEDPAENALVLLNFSDRPVEVQVPAGQEGVAPMLGRGPLYDHLAGEAVPASAGGVRVSLPAHGARVITRARRE